MNAADGTILPGASDSTDQVQQHASDPRYFIKISPGKKKFAPKVRSECLTCKRRRVKCDEARPACNKCLATKNTCEGYQTPQAWIFKSSRDEGETAQTEERPGSSSSSDWEKTSPSHAASPHFEDLDSSQDLALFTKPPDFARMSMSLFQGDRASQQAFEFYMLNTARSVDAIGPMGSLWLVWVPQLAQRYDSMKHMMLGASLLDKSEGFPTAMPPLDVDTARLTKTRALAHYQAAITALLREQPPKVVLILVALIACAWEQAIGNFAAAKMHAEGAAKLNIDASDSDQTLVRKATQLEIDIRKAVPLYVDLCRVRSKEDQCDEVALSNSAGKDFEAFRPLHPRPLSFSSLNESLALVHARVMTYCETSRELDSAIGFQKWLLRWEAASIAYYPKEPETTAQKDATHLFWFVGLAILPEFLTGSRSYAKSPFMVQVALQKVKKLAEQEIVARGKVSARVSHALILVLSVITYQFPDTIHAKEATELLQRIRTSL